MAGITEDGSSPRIDGYYKESHFSDNIIWIEWLARHWHVPRPKPGRGDSTSLPAKPNGASWAWGGAEAANGTDQPDSVTEPIPNLITQVKSYLDDNSASRKTLYVIWAGADNLLIGGKFGPVAAYKATSAIIRSMRKLDRAGARHIMVLNLPNLGLTPEAQSGGRVDEAAATLYSYTFNYFLEKRLARLNKRKLFRAKIYSVDAYSELKLIHDTVEDGDTYTPDFFVPGPTVEIDNVSDEALDVYQDTGEFPTDYLFWDDVHPTTQGHQIIAGKIL